MRKFSVGSTEYGEPAYWAKLGTVKVVAASELVNLPENQFVWVSVEDFLKTYPEEKSYIWLVLGQSNNVVEYFVCIHPSEWKEYAIRLKKL